MQLYLELKIQITITIKLVLHRFTYLPLLLIKQTEEAVYYAFNILKHTEKRFLSIAGILLHHLPFRID